MFEQSPWLFQLRIQFFRTLIEVIPDGDWARMVVTELGRIVALKLDLVFAAKCDLHQIAGPPPLLTLFGRTMTIEISILSYHCWLCYFL